MTRYLDDHRPRASSGERLVGLIVASLILLIIVLLTDQGEPARGERPHRCKAEDEMVVRVEEDAYTFRKGQTVCVHVDQIHAEETR